MARLGADAVFYGCAEISPVEAEPWKPSPSRCDGGVVHASIAFAG